MSEDTMRDIVNRIKRRRLDLEYSFQDLASLTKMSKSTLQRYESGAIKNLPLDKLKILATALDTTPEWIMGWEEKETNNLSYGSIGRNIKELREQNGVSQAELGVAIGSANADISTWENDIKIPRMAVIQKIADFFGVSISRIIENGNNISKKDFHSLDGKLIGLDRALYMETIELSDEEKKDLIAYVQFKKADAIRKANEKGK